MALLDRASRPTVPLRYCCRCNPGLCRHHYRYPDCRSHRRLVPSLRNLRDNHQCSSVPRRYRYRYQEWRIRRLRAMSSLDYLGSHQCNLVIHHRHYRCPASRSRKRRDSLWTHHSDSHRYSSLRRRHHCRYRPHCIRTRQGKSSKNHSGSHHCSSGYRQSRRHRLLIRIRMDPERSSQRCLDSHRTRQGRHPHQGRSRMSRGGRCHRSRRLFLPQPGSDRVCHCCRNRCQKFGMNLGFRRNHNPGLGCCRVVGSQRFHHHRSQPVMDPDSESPSTNHLIRPHHWSECR